MPSSKPNQWQQLKSFTTARVALGRAGGSLSTEDLLRFKKDHALAKDAVWATLNLDKMQEGLQKRSLEVICLESQAADRQQYIKRPDFGRRLNEASVEKLKGGINSSYDISISITDGLSALAVERHALPLLHHLIPLFSAFTIAPIALVREGRVAISDEVGFYCQSQVSIILIGERPGLSSPDSLGIYMTYHPQVGNTDERRNCISNIREEGLPYAYAAQKLSFLVRESLHRKISGVDLKDTFDGTTLGHSYNTLGTG